MLAWVSNFFLPLLANAENVKAYTLKDITDLRNKKYRSEIYWGFYTGDRVQFCNETKTFSDSEYWVNHQDVKEIDNYWIFGQKWTRRFVDFRCKW